MALEADETADKDEDSHRSPSDGKLERSRKVKEEDNDEEEEEEEDEDEDDEEDEPRLNYTSLTKYLRTLYRNGDATSTFLVAGDKMVVGTHNGNVHVFSLPSFKSIKVYHAHTASISSLSISPFPPPIPALRAEASTRISSGQRANAAQHQPGAKVSSPSSRNPKQSPGGSTSSNAIHIGSSSIDGNVCVASLLDIKDVQLRSFGRPIKSVAMSPDYKSDRSYLSGGLAGNLVLTTGGQSGKSSVSHVNGGPAVSAAGWLGAIGLGANTAKDQVLHSGEGAISMIKWSLSGMYVVWVNEKGIKIMRSNLHLEFGESDLAWKRISHIPHPNLPGWEEMAGVWKAHVEWIDEDGLESDDSYEEPNGAVEPSQGSQFMGILSGRNPLRSNRKTRRIEKMVVGWSGSIWIVDVHPGGLGEGKDVGEPKAGRVEVMTILRTDCIISGISLYTPSLLVVLAYITPEETVAAAKESSSRRGVHRRKNALRPEVRIIDIETKEEVCVADTLSMSNFEGLSATDYHLGILPAIRLPNKVIPTRGALEVIGGGLWDATMYPTRLFSSAASVRSFGTPSEQGSSKVPSDSTMTIGQVSKESESPLEPAALSRGMKIFIHSPYDCVLATKTTFADHFSWLVSHHKYEEAWNLLDRYPDIAGNLSEDSSESIVETPLPTHGSLVDFFADDNSSQTTTGARRNTNFQAEKEKRSIGERWVRQLVSAGNWTKAGQTCGKVLGTSSRWEHWVGVFAEANKYEEITPFIPTTQLQSRLPSVVYNIILRHYILIDRVRFEELLQRWPPELFDTASVIEAVQGRLRAGDIREDTVEDGIVGRDWRILTHGLATLFLANGRPRQALRCHIQLQDADAAMNLIAEFHLIDAVSDNIPRFILLRVSKDQEKTAVPSTLEELTLEPIRLLVDEALHGIVPTETVIDQLQAHGHMQQYLFFYFRALWNGNTATSSTFQKPIRTVATAQTADTLPHTERLAGVEGKALVSEHADLAVSLFAEYDRPLLMEFLKTSQSYTLESASKICEQRSFFPERVYLLSKEGRLTQALLLIIDRLNDVSQAIEFCKTQNDQSLWDDMLDYSMNKPRFIRGLLEEVGTAINPISLVRRIPEGLEIEGLRDSLSRMIREYEIQYSISEGVARVLRGEVAAAMTTRGNGQRRGIKFELIRSTKPTINRTVSSTPGQNAPPPPTSSISNSTEVDHSKIAESTESPLPKHPPKVTKPGHCPGCGKAFLDYETQYLVGFACGHIFHLACLLQDFNNRQPTDAGRLPNDGGALTPGQNKEGGIPDALAQMAAGEEAISSMQAPMMGYDRSVGPKVDRAALLRMLMGDGCPVSGHVREG